MIPVAPSSVMAGLMWLSLIAFAVLGGADFGAGVWDLLASGRSREPQRAALIRAIGPIWEANEIWLIFLITGTWTTFPLVFSTVMTALFIPLTLGLLGIVMRGAAFAYYTHFRAAVTVNEVWGKTFSIASLVTPFLFGTVAAAVVSGHIRVLPGGNVVANPWQTWTTPFALACGGFAVALSACLAATYMTVEAANQHELKLVAVFRRRALISGAVAATLGAVSFWLSAGYAPVLFHGLFTRAWPVALAAVLLGVLTAAALVAGFFRTARVLIGGEVTAILGAWALAQFPLLIVPDVSVTRAAAPPVVQTAAIIAAVISMVLVIPATWYLLYLFKSEHGSTRHRTADQLIEQLTPVDVPTVSNSQHTGSRNGSKWVRSIAEGALLLGATILLPAVVARVRGVLSRWRRYRHLPRPTSAT